MASSPARSEANRRNAQLSTGPKTPEGKEHSRANGLKHGLTGRGIVVPEEDVAEVARRCAALEVEMNPSGELGRILVRRVAALSVRLERSVRHEEAAVAERVRHAEAGFDDHRLAEIEKTFAWIAVEPATHARRLRSTPEGIDLMVGCLLGLRDELTGPYVGRWDWTYCERVHHMMGLRREDRPTTRIKALSEAILGDFTLLDPADGEGLDPEARRGWAADRQVELIDAEVASLHAIRESLDRETIDLDRAEAGDRALFDASREAVLARKYEGASERGLYRALREFREVESAVEATPAAESRARGRLASCFPGLAAGEPELDRSSPDPGQPPANHDSRGRGGRGTRREGKPGGSGAGGTGRR